VPFCNIYSTFMQRAYDNVIHDVALQGLGVVMCLDRGGLVGEDGATHHGAYDMAYMNCVPGLTIAAPYDELELRNMMYTASTAGSPWVIRYPRGCGSGIEWRDVPFEKVEVGVGRCLRKGSGVAVLSVGAIGIIASQAVECAVAEGADPAHYDMRWVKPLDENILRAIVEGGFERVVTVEDGSLAGGVGQQIEIRLRDMGFAGKVLRLGIPDRFIEHATPAQLYAECGIDAESIYKAIM
jgi:1-deoxy-D-xylulose-5-phosphate synthase